ncbi:MAG: exosortase family protein XrtF [Flavobacteriales bacterium]
MKEYKPLIFFLLKFFITYFIITLSYDFYLKETQVFNDGNSQTDPYTKEVAKEASALYNLVHRASYVKQNPYHPYEDFFIGEKRIAVINEGCNAVSVMIIMVSFIIAFGTNIISTILYLLFSLVLVHVVNIFRISLLSNIILSQSKYVKLAHDALFPGIIYGTIILICIVWIKFFVFKKRKDE